MADESIMAAVLGMGWLSFAGTAIGWYVQSKKSKRKQKEDHDKSLRNYMRKMRERFSGHVDFYESLSFLRKEASQGSGHNIAKRDDGPDPFVLREIPAFLEPIGIRLRFDPDATDEAYFEFADEVLLCHHSKRMWKNEDKGYNTDDTYWKEFKAFAKEIERRKDKPR